MVDTGAQLREYVIWYELLRIQITRILIFLEPLKVRERFGRIKLKQVLQFRELLLECLLSFLNYK